MQKIKITAAALICGFSLGGCQLISPLFVEYNGVRRDVARWINHQPLLSMQQKRSLAQLSRAQQQLTRYAEKTPDQQLQIAVENQTALQCASQHLSANKIAQLQRHVFGDDKAAVLQRYEQLAPKIKLDSRTLQCD